MPSKCDASVIEELWQRMGAIYGHRWSSSYGLTDIGDTWAIGLASMTPEQIGVGITACIKSGDEWPPSLPKFRAMCLEIPALSKVSRNIFSRRVKDDPFTEIVWSNIDHYRFGQSSAKEGEKMIKAAYEITCDEIAQYPELLITDASNHLTSRIR